MVLVASYLAFISLVTEISNWLCNAPVNSSLSPVTLLFVTKSIRFVWAVEIRRYLLLMLVIVLTKVTCHI